jgi:hypothetical protein
MDEDLHIIGRNDDRLFKQFEAHYDVPAYVRRARGVQDAFEHLLRTCRAKRDELLAMVRTRVGVLHGLAGDWAVLRPLLADDEQVHALRQLHADLNPKLRVPVTPTSSLWALRRAIRELSESIERFNRRWQEFLPKVDLTRVNELRDGYNRYYLLEKECAVRSPRLARQGFHRLEPLTTEELVLLLPPLPVPRLAS